MLLISLEKREPRFWERLLTSECAIDISKLNVEQPYSQMKLEDKMQIEKLVDSKQNSAREKTSPNESKFSQAEMEAKLRAAWDMEGSPFRGQPFDPSILSQVAKK